MKKFIRNELGRNCDSRPQWDGLGPVRRPGLARNDFAVGHVTAHAIEVVLFEALLERLVRVRWMLEELRVSLFAQELRTAEAVSPQRIAKALAG